MADDIPSIAEVLSDPTASLWLETALRSALHRDPVDAANDCEFLARLLKRRRGQILSDFERVSTELLLMFLTQIAYEAAHDVLSG